MKKNSWSALVAIYLASIAIVINQYKVAPVLPDLMNDLNATLTIGGWFMGIFSITGVILALPGALLVSRFGYKRSGLISILCVAAGSMIGTFATESNSMLIGRSIEGVGLGMMSVIAPALITVYFSKEKRALPIGIWATWVPVGSILVFMLSNSIVNRFNWQGLWIFGTFMALAAFVIFAIVIKEPEVDCSQSQKTTLPLSTGLKSVHIWLLGIGFLAFSLGNNGLVTWATPFFTTKLNINPLTANSYLSLFLAIMIPALILSGWLGKKVKNIKIIVIPALIVMGALYAYSFRLESEALIPAYMITAGLTVGLIPTCFYVLAGEVLNQPELFALAHGIIGMGRAIGCLIGPPLVGFSIETTSQWQYGSVPMVIGVATSLVYVVFLKVNSIQGQES